MAFRPFVQTMYHDWVVQQKWNYERIRFDRVATKGSQCVEQGSMTYRDFFRHLDKLDGRSAAPAPVVRKEPRSVPEPEPRRAAEASGHPSLFGDDL